MIIDTLHRLLIRSNQQSMDKLLSYCYRANLSIECHRSAEDSSIDRHESTHTKQVCAFVCSIPRYYLLCYKNKPGTKHFSCVFTETRPYEFIGMALFLLWMHVGIPEATYGSLDMGPVNYARCLHCLCFRG